MSRLVLFSIFIGCFCTSLIYADHAGAQDIQKVNISINVNDANVTRLFSLIEKKSGVEFLYVPSALKEVEVTFSYQTDSISIADLLSDISNRTGLWFWQINSAIAVNTANVWPSAKTGQLICPKVDDCSSMNFDPDAKGNLKGKVTDASSGDPVLGATIVLEGTSLGTSTNKDGEFRLKAIPVGSQTFLIRYLGYKTEKLQVMITSDKVTEVSIELHPDVVEGEINVYSQAEGQAKAIRSQTSSTSVVNVVSEARIRELPDANAAESVGRLPGVSVIRDSGEGQRIAIRGLSPRHNSITLDGDRIPSSDENGRAVNLNMISPEMLSGIELYKSLRPDMDADAIGGTVNFKFAGVPDKRSLRVNISSGYSNHIEEVGSYSTSFYGSGRFLNNKLGILASLDAERNDRSSDNFNGSYIVLRDAREGEEFAPLGVTSVNLSDKQEKRDRYGAGLILDFNIPNGKIMLNNFASRLSRDITDRGRQYDVESFTQSYGLANTESKTDILSSRLSGEHGLDFGFLEWRLSRNISELRTPYDHSVSFEETGAFIAADLDETRGPSFVPGAAVNDGEDTHFNGSTFTKKSNKETDYTGQLDVTIPVRVGSQLSGEVKAGGKGVIKERTREGRNWHIRSGDATYVYENEQRDWIFTRNGRLSIENYLDPHYNSSSFLDNQYDMSIGLDEGQIRELWKLHANNHIERLTIQFDDQEVTERVYASYGLTELNIGPKLVVLAGTRYEYTNSDYTAKKGQVSGNYRNLGTITDTTASQKFGMLFPMAHVRFKVTNWLDIRAAFTETISRPDFSELLPREEVSANSRLVRRGSPKLKPAEATNYDLFFTAYSNRLGLVSVGGFYKQINNLIYDRKAVVINPDEEGLDPQTRGYDLYEPYNNPNETTVKGFEIEWQSNLTYLPIPFNGLVMNLNFTRIWSETQYPQFYLERTSEGIVGVDTYREGPMVNQPDYVANLSLGYDYKSFSSRVSMVYQGATLTGVGARPETDSFTEEFIRWDAAVKYNFVGGLSLFMNLQNLNDRPDLSTQFTDQFSTYQQYYGWSAELGIRYDIY